MEVSVTSVRTVVDPVTAVRVSVTDHPTPPSAPHSVDPLVVEPRVPGVVGLLHADQARASRTGLARRPGRRWGRTRTVRISDTELLG